MSFYLAFSKGTIIQKCAKQISETTVPIPPPLRPRIDPCNADLVPAVGTALSISLKKIKIKNNWPDFSKIVVDRHLQDKITKTLSLFRLPPPPPNRPW